MLTMAGACDIRSTVRSKAPNLPFCKIKELILGDKYELSLVICSDTLATRMNREYRKKSYKPNVLSFPLSENEGEIFLNIRKAAREAKTMGVSTKARIAHLFIHGCYHLKGLDHGPVMDKAEEKMLRKFGFAA